MLLQDYGRPARQVKDCSRGGWGSWRGSSVTSWFVWSQVQMFQVRLPLHGGPGGPQIPAVAEGGPGWLHVWCNRVRNMFEPVFWHWCKFFTEVSTGKLSLGMIQLLKCAQKTVYYYRIIAWHPITSLAIFFTMVQAFLWELVKWIIKLSYFYLKPNTESAIKPVHGLPHFKV